MKRETKERIKGKFVRIGHEIKELAPGILFWSGLGMMTYSYFGTMDNRREIRKLKGRTDKTEEDIRGIVHWADDIVVPRHNAFADETNKRLNQLEEENRALMARALKETEGKG